LQIERDPQYIEDEKERDKAFKALAFAKVALSQEILQCLPGKSYVRGDSIMDDHMMLSGKMVALDYYLSQYASRGDRVLVFSYSTRTLDLIQHYVRGQGYTHVRLDGSTPTSKRQSIIDEFQKNEDIFLFLISTKAGGLGLNLTAANRVIVYDVNWNPSYDEQAQDRAYRIGQSKDVEVIRFVARGTIEELMYARQIYKVHLKKQTLESTKDQYLPQPARLFSGVDKDKVRKGELFGLENLLKYKDGSFMADMWSSKENEKIVGKKKIPEVIATDTLATFLGKLSEEQMNQLGGEEAVIDVMPEEDSSECSGVDDTVIRHDDFLRDDRGGAVNNDEDFGGETQMACIANELAIERLGAKSPVEKLKSEEKDKGRRSLKLPSYLRKG
jgi:superfamily II DNA/RNA helicase